MAIHEPSLVQLRIIAIIGATMAILATVFRLYLRARKRNLWWDDFWAGLSMVAMIIMLTGMMLFTSPPDAHPYNTKIAAYYMFDNGFYGVIWCARVSLFCTIIRMAFGRFRTFLKWCVASVLVTWAVLFAQVFWTCENEPMWKDKPTPQCSLGTGVAIAQLITDCIFDLLLIISPAYLLSHIKNRKTLKIRLIAIFSSTILVTIFSIVHSYMILKDYGKLEFLFAAVIQDVVSLLVVNLTVIAAWLFRLSDDNDSESPYYVNTFLRGRWSDRLRNKSQVGTTAAFGLTTLGVEVIVDTQDVSDQRDGKLTVVSILEGDQSSSDNVHKLPPAL
ncbi:hypothetical protein Moror_11038 [Moniliophthora roreri MCA 2997]|uniref:Rhodopsin domain-containing protein n=1 Tax=Moniliophthora roreri (strain MCA 2997) TaxID=1381753 RepID=V2WWZ4_MONRO|nr:hypothetical protein Moror_11038 [Moniliophthora roreri MCA 2997]